eukprot:TRINITY_DN42506_c0_g1_i1.p1 TRINITY_DN42506_c0_g1~~TRINITY_DN42506_c0_g1_i1.p1  ORF type:complete len:279 (+),score=36.12 TRINITY_DN42506_c0_g1_i1:71-838(+)
MSHGAHNDAHGHGHDSGSCGHDHGKDCGSDCEAGDAGETTTTKSLAGGLILRGCRCVLVRSLEGEWEGMRIPWVAVEAGESSQTAALRAVSDLCEIEEDEVYVLKGVPPVVISVPSLPPIMLHAIYAKNAPPAGPLENADVEDPEDTYDWYTFPRAMAALSSDPYARAALATMACSLVAGAASGMVPDQWGGVFGEEWVANAWKQLPGGPPELPSAKRTITDIAADSNRGAASSKRPRDEDEATGGRPAKKQPPS